ncbi:penicillin-binding protein, partial [Micromonospora mirobrigensis]
LERYLNIASFGNGAYGIYAASQVYFGKPPSKLKIEEAAMLAGMVKAPTTNDPTTKAGYPLALDRRNYVIKNMVITKAITQAEADKALATKMVVKDKRTPNGCVSTNKKGWGFFCDYFYRWWMAQETFGSTTYDRERRLKSGGYTIVTTLDPQAQDGADAAVRRNLGVNSKKARMLAVVEPGTGRVRALSVNRNFKLDNPARPQNKLSSNPAKAKLKIRGNYPNTVVPLLTGGGDIKGYQAGSTFKMFTMVAALEKGVPLGRTFNAPDQFQSNYIIQKGSPAACKGTHFYCPKNSVKSMAGVQTMWSAFGKSVNTFFVALEQEVGAENVIKVAQKLGITFRDSDDARRATKEGGANQWGAFTLGVSQTTPLELANAYATLAADGKYCNPIPVQEIKGPDGKKLDIANPSCEQRISTEVARAAIDAARCPVGDHSSTSKCGGNGTARETRGIVNAPVAGKSGTTDSDKTSALVAMTRQYAVAGIMADPDWPQTNVKMGHKEPDGINPPVMETLRDAMKGKPRLDWTPPSGKVVVGDLKSVPGVTCLPIDVAKSKLRDAGFQPVVAGVPVPSSCGKNTAAGTSPDGKSTKGGVITILVSAGTPTPTPPLPGTTVIPPPPGPPTKPGKPRG